MAMVAVVATLVGCDSRTHESAYADAATARAQGGRWITRVLPDGASEIHELHDFEDNYGWTTFRFTAEDVPRLKASLTALGATSDGNRPLESPYANFAWWPPDAPGVDAERFRFLDANDRQPAHLAIHWATRRAYLYREPM